MSESFGAMSLLPTLFVLVTAIWLKRSLEPLVLGTIVGYIMLFKADFGSEFLSGMQRTMGGETIRWIILVVLLFGALISLLQFSGSVTAFANTLAKRIRNRSQVLLTTWFLGLLIFIDDYLNALSVSSSMRAVVDKLKVSREMLAYVVDSTSAPICILMPFSTWAIFVSGLLEDNGVATTGQGLVAYIGAIPFMFYAWIAVMLVPLVASGKVPPLFAMKKAEDVAKHRREAPSDDTDTSAHRGGIFGFLVPMASLIFFTLWFDTDVLMGATIALLITFLLYGLYYRYSMTTLFDVSIDGMKSMLEVIAILVTSFALKDVNDMLGLTNYVIEVATSHVIAGLLPAITFVSLALVAFCTGSFWGLYAIAVPIVIPLASTTGTNMSLMLGAVISAGAFGSHACFYSDSTVLSAKGAGCSTISHALTQVPYIAISGMLSLMLFLIFGFYN
ncbi:MAG: sodium:proton antiporter [Alteromonadaceae bacterium]|nr:sodium:proton antiporter [Alteromonadaceae bacterium]